MAEHVASVLLHQSNQIASPSSIGTAAFSRRFAARLSGLAFGLALAVRPAGLPLGLRGQA